MKLFFGWAVRWPVLFLIVWSMPGTSFCQTSPQSCTDQPLESSYEVATVKPFDGNGFALTLRQYLLAAFSSQHLSSEQLIGPPWLGQKSYVIQGKASEAVESAMQKMNLECRAAQSNLMMRSLLADRFKFQYHVEKRRLAVYKLVAAKGGLKVGEPADSTKSGLSMSGDAKTHELKGIVSLPDLIGLLQINDPEIGQRPLIDGTGLGRTTYKLSLRWSATGGNNDGSDTQTPRSGDAPSIFTALQEQLGIKALPAKAAVDVIVIDHIEAPSEN